MGCCHSKETDANLKPRGRPPVESGNTIQPYKPDEKLLQTYREYIAAIHKQTVAIGIRYPSHTSVMEPVLQDDEGGGDSETEGRTSLMSRKYPLWGRSTTTEQACRQGRRETRLRQTSAPECISPRHITAFQCFPLHMDAPIGVGQHSEVVLAAMHVLMGDPRMFDATTLTSRPPNATTELTRSSSILENRPHSKPTVGSGSLSFSTPPAADSVPLSSVPLPLTADHSAISYTVPHSASAFVEKRFLIAMKTLPILEHQPAQAILRQVRGHVQRWSRLSAYCPRLLRCVQMEAVYTLTEGDKTVTVTRPVPQASYHYFEGVVRLPSPGGSVHASRPADTSLLSSSGTLTGPYAHLVNAAPSGIRIFMELGRYGTLHRFQRRTMLRLFRERRLHELTVRVIMREVLLALLFLHDSGELQYDLCAKRVFLHASLHRRYKSYFPAYISNLPVGPLEDIPPDRLTEVLALADPVKTSGLHVPEAVAAPSHTAGEPITPPDNNTASCEDASRQNLTFSRMAFQCYPCSEDRAVGSPSPLDVVAPHGETSSEGRPRAPHCEAFLPRESFPGEPSWDLAGSASAGGAHESVGSDTQHHSEKLWQCLKAHRYQDTEDVSFPSPHDGCHGYEEAEALARNTISSELPPTTQCMRVLSLRNADDAGGIVIIQPDQFQSTSTTTTGHAVNGNGACEDKEMAASYAPLPQLVAPGTDLSDFVLPADIGVFNRRTDFEQSGSESVPRRHPYSCSPDLESLSAPMATNPLSISGGLGSPVTCDSSGESILRCRQHPREPLIKVVHDALIRRSFGQCPGSPEPKDVPVHCYVSVAHAAPEVLLFNEFSEASDVYAFAMMFIELVTTDGVLFPDLAPRVDQLPRTRQERAEYEAAFASNLRSMYSQGGFTRAFKEPASSSQVSLKTRPPGPPFAVAIPEYLSEDCKNVLRWCLQPMTLDRPNVAQLLATKYFMRGDWIDSDPSRGTPAA